MSIIGACMVPHPPIILPEVGHGEEVKIRATAESFKKAAAFIAELRPDTIVVTSPHSVMYSDYFHISPGRRGKGSMRRFRAPQVKFDVEYDLEFTDELSHLCELGDFPAGTMGERDPELDHGTMIPLYFVNQFYKDYKLVRIGLAGLSLDEHYHLGQLIKETAKRLGRRVFFVGSGDLSHKLKDDGPYGFAKEGPVYDDRIMDVMGRAAFGELLDFDEAFCEKAAECGHRSFCIMAGALDRTAVEPVRLSHEGTFGVGYGVCLYKIKGEDENRNFLDMWMEEQSQKLAEIRKGSDPYVVLARASVESFVTNKKKIRVPEELGDILDSPIPDEMLCRRAGVFVSIHKNGRLRGCIGTIGPTKANIAEEIVSNAISASTRDPRFSPIKPKELADLEISVDVLGETEHIDSVDELDVKRYGVIVSKGFRRGLLLPNLDGVDTVDQQVQIAMDKAGIDYMEDNIRLERFEVVRHY